MALAVLFAGHALAHALQHPKQVAVSIGRAEVQVATDLEIAPGPQAQALRATYDLDHNGALDALEQARLVAFLAATATQGTRVSLAEPVPGWRGFFSTRFTSLALTPLAPPRGERTDDATRSTALLAVHVVQHAALPAADPGAKRTLRIEDESSAAGGHVPLRVSCAQCVIISSSLGVSAHDPRGDQVLGAEVAPSQPLEVVVRVP